MATINAVLSVTLDGVMQGLGRPDEDVRGGFVHGGWGPPYADQVGMAEAGKGIGQTTAMLFGHRTYDDLMSIWLDPANEPNPFTEVFANTPKYVCSRSAQTRADWPASEVLLGEAADTVADLRRRVDGMITILGSGELVRSLHAARLIDTFTLSIHPIVMGSGQRLFADGERADLRLVRSVPTTTGVILAEYATVPR